VSGEITAAYSALVALIFVVLSMRTLLLRRKLGIGVGVGDNSRLIKAARAHSNFAEYAPICLILIYLLETVAGGQLLVHMYGAILILGRTIHAYGIGQVEENYKFRVVGMACTFIVIIGCSVRLLRATLLS